MPAAAGTLDGDQTIGKVSHACQEVWSPCRHTRPRSSLPATVLAWLATRLAHLAPPRPPGQGGTRPLPLEVRLDAVGAVLLDGLSYRRAGRVVGISKTEVGDSLDLLLGPLAALGFCQPDGSFIATVDQLGRWLSEMARAGEAVLVDGLGTGCNGPGDGRNQKVLYDAKRHTHTAQGLALSTIWGDSAVGRWRLAGQLPTSTELMTLSGLTGALDGGEVAEPAGRRLPRAGQGAWSTDRRRLARPPHHRPAR